MAKQNGYPITTAINDTIYTLKQFIHRILYDNWINDFKMKLEKIKQEPITINQNSYMAIKTQMNPTGLLGKLWKAVIYYDKETGKMLSYEAPSGPPGSKKTIITLVEN